MVRVFGQNFVSYIEAFMALLGEQTFIPELKAQFPAWFKAEGADPPPGTI